MAAATYEIENDAFSFSWVPITWKSLSLNFVGKMILSHVSFKGQKSEAALQMIKVPSFADVFFSDNLKDGLRKNILLSKKSNQLLGGK